MKTTGKLMLIEFGVNLAQKHFTSKSKWACIARGFTIGALQGALSPIGGALIGAVEGYHHFKNLNEALLQNKSYISKTKNHE